MPELTKALRNARRRLSANLMRTFSPHMWESGYKTGPDRRGDFASSRPLKVWAPRDKHGKPTSIVFNGYSLQEFLGFAENGIMTAAYGGGCIIEPLSTFPLEDLMMLNKWAIKQFEIKK